MDALVGMDLGSVGMTRRGPFLGIANSRTPSSPVISTNVQAETPSSEAAGRSDGVSRLVGRRPKRLQELRPQR